MENIRYGRLDASNEEIYAAAELANADWFIRRLPQGYQTQVSEQGHNFSQGQRQLLAIARAIYFNAKVLIMDEPTAALGPQETAMVSELIKQLKSEGVGIFLISHDLHDVFDLSDRVSVLKNGRLIGTRRTSEVTKDEVLGMIIMGKLPVASKAV